MHPDLHCVEADAERSGDLRVRELFVFAENESGSIVRRKLIDEPIEALTHFLSEHTALTVGRAVCWPLLTCERHF